MDQQNQDQQKKKNNHYHNRRRGNGNGGAAHEAADTHTNEARAENRNEARPANRGGRGGEIHTRRGGFHPAPDQKPEEGKATVEAPRESKENREHREPRDNNHHNNPKNRNGKGRNDSRPHDGHSNEARVKEGGQKDRRPQEASKEAQNTDARAERGNDNRSRGRNDRNRGRRGENRNASSDFAETREHVNASRDAEMDAWFAPASPANHNNGQLFSDKPAIAADPEPLPHVELDLNDILPPIVLEKYHTEETKANEDAAAQTEGAEAAEPTPTVEVVGVRFSRTGKVYFFDPNGNTARRGDAVIVETARGLEFGEVWQPNHSVSESEIVPPLRPIVRLADEKDVTHNADNRKREEDAFHICLDKISAHGLDMKLVEAQYTFDNSKLLFYFTSAGRVDFRELVKDLASVFRTRIELRQIGIRDEAKLMGGLGICGRPLCCASFLSDFSQVSIKMAKEQNLSLNSAKISGTCGRLMCCLNYEYPVYCEAARHTPSLGSTVATPDGNGTVIETNPLAGVIKVSLTNAAQGAVPQYYRCADVRQIGEGRKPYQEESSHTETQDSKEN